eukprot:6372137-Prymnesium_polylepis.1
MSYVPEGRHGCVPFFFLRLAAESVSGGARAVAVVSSSCSRGVTDGGGYGRVAVTGQRCASGYGWSWSEG